MQEAKIRRTIREFDDMLREVLSDPKQVVEYLRAALNEKDPHTLALAIRDVLKATRSMPEATDAETAALCRALAGLQQAGVKLDFLER